jgi:transcriptional regulator with XRE-family HTH domain
MKLIGQRLRWVREALSLSQEQIATRVGVHQTAWSLYERGLRMPDQFEVPRLAAKLQISIPYILGEGLEGVERELAIRLAAQHPELVENTGTDRRTGTDLS